VLRLYCTEGSKVNTTLTVIINHRQQIKQNSEDAKPQRDSVSYCDSSSICGITSQTSQHAFFSRAIEDFSFLHIIGAPSLHILGLILQVGEVQDSAK